MADQPDVFNSDKPQGNPQQNTPPSDDPLANQLMAIKNENGEQKYDSMPKALEGLANAQTYIPQLKTELATKEAELADMRAKLEQSASVEEVVSRLTAQQESSQQAPSTPQQPTGLDEQAVLNLFQQYTQQQTVQQVAASNAEQVQNALVSKFGDKTQEAVQLKAAELGMTPESIGALAKQSPQAALALFGGGAVSAQPNTSSIQTTLHTPEPEQLKRPEKSILAGATSKEQAEFMRRVKEEVYRKYDVKT
ncbi:hypothetical protein N9924_00755 [bacterium]|nr:hypothetical protein [bacterium]